MVAVGIPRGNYLSIGDFCKKIGVSRQRVHIWLKEDRIPGAIFLPHTTLIPADATRPEKIKQKPRS